MRIDTVSAQDIPQDVKDFLYEYLYKPWGVAYEIDWLSAGDGGEFLIARDEDGILLGTTRIMPSDDGSVGHPTPPECAGERRLRQVLVDPALRGQGIGSKLMQVAETRVLELGIDKTGVAARCEAYDFYLSQGYSFFGDEYISQLTHIPHTHMSKDLEHPKNS